MKIIKYFLIWALAAAACLAGCARYAPLPPEPPPARTLLDIELVTAQPISNDFHYYIVLNAAPGATEGPYEVLSGANRAKNWSYYIVYHNGVFEEQLLNSAADADLYPTRFDNTSERYYAAQAAGNTISISMYLDKLVTTRRYVYFNFITSRNAVTDDLEEILPVDYLRPPYFRLDSERYPVIQTNLNNASISTYSPSADADKPADIVSWTTTIYSRQ